MGQAAAEGNDVATFLCGNDDARFPQLVQVRSEMHAKGSCHGAMPFYLNTQTNPTTISSPLATILGNANREATPSVHNEYQVKNMPYATTHVCNAGFISTHTLRVKRIQCMIVPYATFHHSNALPGTPAPSNYGTVG